MTRILDKYRDHTAHLVIEMPQAVFRELDPTSLGLLGAMSANGVRFALDQLVDLRLDPRALFDRGIRFVKAPAALLQAHVEGRVQSDIDAGDLAALLARMSITLVADQVEDNPAAADMIELGATMGQGLAFSPPRPVKPEVFAEPEPATAAVAAAAPLPPPVPAEAARPPLNIVDRLLGQDRRVPAPPAPPEVAPQEARPERLPFRAVLRRASA